MKLNAVSLLLAMCVCGGLTGAVMAADAPVSGAAPLPPVEAGGSVGEGVPAFLVAKGYRVTVAISAGAEGRFMELDNFENLYISGPKKGAVTSFHRQPDGTYAQTAVVTTGKPTTHGLCFSDGWLWYTSSGGVFKGKVRPDGSGLDNITTVLPADGSLPSGGGHWYRPILVDKEGFYTGIGDPENLSDQTATDREKIWRYTLDGKSRTLFCSGIRNTEKLRYRPGTTEVWGCDHGSDDFGYPLGDVKGNQPITDRLPGEEINHYEQGKFYGHPFIVDANLIRPEFAKKPDIEQIKAKSTPPAYLLPAHFADNGWMWLEKDSAFGKTGDMVITSHGSWDSVLKVGYCVSILPFENGKPTQAHRLVSCISEDAKNVMGRPVDVVQDPVNGDLLFSVDAPRPRVYRVSAEPGK